MNEINAKNSIFDSYRQFKNYNNNTSIQKTNYIKIASKRYYNSNCQIIKIHIKYLITQHY